MLWWEWKRDHPQTTVMAEDPQFRFDYFSPSSSKRGLDIFPSGFRRTIQSVDIRLPPSALCYGVVVDGVAKAYPFSHLAKQEFGLLHDEVNGVPLLIRMDPITLSSTALDRRLGEKILQFEDHKNGRLREVESQSIFNSDGLAVSGSLVGKQLKPVFGLQAEWYGWYATYPETELFVGIEPTETK